VGVGWAHSPADDFCFVETPGGGTDETPLVSLAHLDLNPPAVRVAASELQLQQTHKRVAISTVSARSGGLDRQPRCREKRRRVRHVWRRVASSCEGQKPNGWLAPSPATRETKALAHRNHQLPSDQPIGLQHRRLQQARLPQLPQPPPPHRPTPSLATFDFKAV
jgi:hypothetical protein